MKRMRPRLGLTATAARFDALLRPHVPGLYRTAYRFTRRREDAEDLVQDLLTKLYPRTSDLERIEDLRPWLVRSLYNAFIDSVRKRQRTPQPVHQDEAALEDLSDPRDDVLRYEQRLALDDAIAGLSPDHRAVVMLHLVEGYSLAELNAMLGVELGTLKSRLHRAKAQLKDALQTTQEPFRTRQRVANHEL